MWLTIVDVLHVLETIRICSGNKDAKGQVLVDAPTDADSYIGLQPVYEQVFAPGSPAARFLDRYAAALTLAGKSGSSEYRLA
jgi:adenylosuccinate synthase